MKPAHFRALTFLSAGLLVFAFVLDPLAGRLIWLSCQRALVRQEVSRHIISRDGKEGLVLLEFTKYEAAAVLRWEHPREFEYEGRMYDVFEVQDLGDTVRFLCLWDREETKLNAEMRSLALQALGQSPRFGEQGGPAVEGPQPFCRTSPGGELAGPAPASHRLSRLPSGVYDRTPLKPPTPPPERG